MALLLFAHAAAPLFMARVIWFAWVVHNPLFASVGRSGFAAHSGAHTPD
jgi:hypothetical protein